MKLLQLKLHLSLEEFSLYKFILLEKIVLVYDFYSSVVYKPRDYNKKMYSNTPWNFLQNLFSEYFFEWN